MSHPIQVGKLISKEEHKDAIHVAIAPVVAANKLKPGQHVTLIKGNTVGLGDKNIGIVDPFLKNSVLPGQQFWLFLYPNTVTSLRHEWEHPSFEHIDNQELTKGEKLKQESIEWLTNFASRLDMSYDKLIEAARRYVKNGETYCLGFDTPSFCYDDANELWQHIMNVTDNPFDIPEEGDRSFFRCAC